uniref:Nucleolar protein 8 n=1 Tax=Lepisosteus oculatus TaxID=7918 RepID=W5N8Y8_LEPOC|nr:PREDICTED: nucleolar protein 8 [Lepisosteus oculatus]
MDQGKVMRRLYVGGLNHTISQSELKQRFGKFGDVLDVDIVTRKDEEGTPVKTFGYLNITISEKELSKCMSLLNKTKWKGGTLQIELAKESFLHKLAQERQQAAQKKQTPKTERRPPFLDSLKKVGVDNFHMKAAVPGTEVPGHKNWVVSKFGRVLPVLNMKNQGKNKIVKYDPSKNCHNIKKLEQAIDFDNFTPVSKLTWELTGGDDDISKKRRGEFPLPKSRPKKMMKPASFSSGKEFADSDLEVIRNSQDHRLSGNVNNKQVKSPKVNQEAKPPLKPCSKEENFVGKKHSAALKAQNKSMNLFDSDVDSEDEIRKLVVQEDIRNASLVEEDVDNLEVVEGDFVLKPNFRQLQHPVKDGNKAKAVNTSGRCDSEHEYDSADTDEILTSCKTAAKSQKHLETSIIKTGVPDSLSVTAQKHPPSSKIPSSKRTKTTQSDNTVTFDFPPSSTESISSDEGSDQSCDSEYESMMANCCRFELSLADLEKIANESSRDVEEEIEDCQESDVEAKATGGSDLHINSKKKTPIKSSARRGITPEDILASLLNESSSEDEYDGDKKKKMKKQKSPLNLPAFKGTKTLEEAGMESGVCQKRKQEEGHLGAESLKKKKITETQEDKWKAATLEVKTTNSKPPPFKGVQHFLPKSEKTDSTALAQNMEERETEESDFDSSDSDGEDTITKPKASAKKLKGGESPVSSKAQPTPSRAWEGSSSSSSSSTSAPGEESSAEENDMGKAKARHSQNTTTEPTRRSCENLASLTNPIRSTEKADVVVSIKVDSKASWFSSSENALKQQQDNEKRLAALQQRQKEAEQQKRLIQGALSKLDTSETSKGKHIVFESEEESDEEAKETTLRKSLFAEREDSHGGNSSEEEDPGIKTNSDPTAKVKEFKKQVAGKLFENSEDEASSEDDNDDRFQIKPQFEGKAGQKLMALQSRFGTDERFRMDTRFLESDEQSDDSEEAKSGEEDELEEEKRKNMEILQNLLNINIHTPETVKETAKKKTFRDVNALHYDPTKEEHAALETKAENPQKESKAARRKKREEAEKLPEVSKEIYYKVAVDLKEVFGPQKEKGEEKRDVAWDKKEDETTAVDNSSGHIFNFSSSSGAGKEESTGFTFSFFGDDAANEPSVKEGDYKIELLKPAKVPWQEDPRFQESSSEEEDEGETGEKPVPDVTKEEPFPAKKTNLFFFFKDDERLKEGPKMFCRSVKLEQGREQWEADRGALIEEYKKRHKDAKRIVKVQQAARRNQGVLSTK